MKDITPKTQNGNTLVYQGVSIKEKGEMLSLTDMWRASGAGPQKAPAKWRALPNTKTFVDYVEVTVGKSDTELFKVQNGGRNTGTLAHWQIALAYAKYLSPEFHMWCNQVVRDHMEVKAVSTQHNLTSYDISIIGNVVKNCTALVVQQQLEQALPDMIDEILKKRGSLSREGKTAKQIWESAGLPPRIKNATTWFGNRLKEMGCCIANEGRADRGNGTVRLFDPDKARMFLKNGLLHKTKVYASERMGQAKFRLVGKS